MRNIYHVYLKNTQEPYLKMNNGTGSFCSIWNENLCIEKGRDCEGIHSFGVTLKLKLHFGSLHYEHNYHTVD